MSVHISLVVMLTINASLFLSKAFRHLSYLISIIRPGSNWLALRIDRTSVEVFDPLGFDISLWPRIPIFLFDYLRRLSLHRKLLFSCQIKNSTSVL